MKLQMTVFAAMIVASSAAVAAPSEAYKCYKPDSGQSIYPWDNAGWWYPSVADSSSCGVPTSADHVFLYSSKNDVSSNGKPMVVTNGVDAATGVMAICDNSHGTSFIT